MFTQLRDSIGSSSWSDQAIRDTISVIAKDPAYNRALSQSLIERLLRFIFDQLQHLFDVTSSVPYGRTIVTVLVILNYITYYIQKLIEQKAELEKQVLFLTVKVGELRELNNKLEVQNQVFRYEAAAAHRTLQMHQGKGTKRYFTRAEWEVGSEAWQALSEEEKDRVLHMMQKHS